MIKILDEKFEFVFKLERNGKSELQYCRKPLLVLSLSRRFFTVGIEKYTQ